MNPTSTLKKKKTYLYVEYNDSGFLYIYIYYEEKYDLKLLIIYFMIGTVQKIIKYYFMVFHFTYRLQNYEKVN